MFYNYMFQNVRMPVSSSPTFLIFYLAIVSQSEYAVFLIILKVLPA